MQYGKSFLWIKSESDRNRIEISLKYSYLLILYLLIKKLWKRKDITLIFVMTLPYI